MNCPKSHCNQCSKLARNQYQTKIITNFIASGLNQYENVWVKLLRSLKTLNFGTAGDIEQHVLRRTHNVPIAKSVKKLFFYMVQAT